MTQVHLTKIPPILLGVKCIVDFHPFLFSSASFPLPSPPSPPSPALCNSLSFHEAYFSEWAIDRDLLEVIKSPQVLLAKS